MNNLTPDDDLRSSRFMHGVSYVNRRIALVTIGHGYGKGGRRKLLRLLLLIYLSLIRGISAIYADGVGAIQRIIKSGGC